MLNQKHCHISQPDSSHSCKAENEFLCHEKVIIILFILQLFCMVSDVSCHFTSVFCPLLPESPVHLSGPVTALCFSQEDDLCLAGYESGLLELWQHSVLVGHKQVKKCMRQRDLYWTLCVFLCLCTNALCLFVCVCQASDSAITAVCSMPHSQFAVGYTKCFVDVWKLVWNQQHSTAR